MSDDSNADDQRKAAFRRAFDLRKAEALAESEGEFRQALRQFPSFGSGWKGFGDVLRRQGKFRAAYEAFTEATKLIPDDELVSGGRFFSAKRAHIFVGATEEAKRWLERAKNGAKCGEDYIEDLEVWLANTAACIAQLEAEGKPPSKR